MDKTYTVTEVAELFEKTPASVRHWISKKWLPAEIVGKRGYVITHEALVKFVIKSPKHANDKVLERIGFNIDEIYAMKACQFLGVEYVPGETTVEEMIGKLADRLTDCTEQIQATTMEIRDLEYKRRNLGLDCYRTEWLYKEIVNRVADETMDEDEF